MEKFQELQENAKKNYRIADHMLNVTYPLLKDTKLLLGVTENLFLALMNSMSSLLHYERIFKLVPHFQDNFESKFHIFCSRCTRRHNLDQDYPKLIQEMKEIILLHKKSPVTFRRKDRFIICTSKYQVKAITSHQLRNNLKKTKEFLNIITKLTKNG